MMTKILQGFITLILIICLGSGYIFPQNNQNGALTGHVTAANTKEALPFANIMIVGTNSGAASSIDGKFIIRDIVAGKHKVKITYIGYEEKVEEITIQPNKTLEINIVLQPHNIESKEVVITAQAQGQLNAINQQINSNTIKNVVSPERLQENPDANAAEALGRLPGISLIRSGGEGVAIVIRGMNPEYSTVTLNGVQLPSNTAGGTNTSISGISQFLLQTVEVYKAITPDMDGNSVAGSINLKLAEAPDSLRCSLLAHGGYNHLNDYWGNYKFVGDISDRLFNKKLGIRLNVDVEKVNRSTQTLGANYSVNSNVTGGLGHEPVLIQGVNLNNITNIPSRQSGTLILDYSFSPTSKVFLYNLFSRQYTQFVNVYKTFGPTAARQSLGYNLQIVQYAGTSLLFSSSVRVEHSLSWMDIDYGVAFSQTHGYIPDYRSWTFLQGGTSSELVTTNSEKAVLTPKEFIAPIQPYNNGSDSSMALMVWWATEYASDDLFQKNITPYFDVRVPLSFGNSISGYIKGGAKYNQINRERNYVDASINPPNTPNVMYPLASAISWVKLNSSRNVTGLGLVDHEINNFLDGQFNFGWYPNLDRLNQLWNWYNTFSNNALAEGKDSVNKKFNGYIGFFPIIGSALNDQDFDQKYIGAYLMSEINLGDLITFLPGARYEKVTYNLTGRQVSQNVPTFGLSIPFTALNATHNDEFWLPMAHLQIKPNDWIRIHLSYTNALGRPVDYALIPNSYTYTALGSYLYIAGNPYLKPELWTNYDIQIMLYGNEVGLFSVTGYYKKVRDKIWQRSFKRLPSDPPITGFPNNAVVSVQEWVNHQDPGYIKGAEFEWQTNFWYLPEPLKYFSLNLNYTILTSKQQYPFTRLYTTITFDSTGRPHPSQHRVDSTITDQMLNQPNSIVNVSLGFNYKGLNAWLSFQYNGKTLTGWTSQRELIPYTGSFHRWDFQIVQKLPLEGMEVLFNVANISDYQQVSTMLGDSRPTYMESYGWTSDLGLRYNF